MRLVSVKFKGGALDLFHGFCPLTLHDGENLWKERVKEMALLWKSYYYLLRFCSSNMDFDFVLVFKKELSKGWVLTPPQQKK